MVYADSEFEKVMKNAIFVPIAVLAVCARAYAADHKVDFVKSVAPIF